MEIKKKTPAKKTNKPSAGTEGKVTKRPVRNKFLARILPDRPVYIALVYAMALLAVAFLLVMAAANAFPSEITMGLIVVLFAMIILGTFLMKRPARPARIAGIVVAVLFMSVYGLATYYLGTTYAAMAKMTAGNTDRTYTAGPDVSKESFNIYITGIDMWNYEKGYDMERSDVNMIVTVCPITRKILLTSIPRDTYVKLHTAQQMDKLTHTGVYGVDETLNTVHDWLGVSFDYYVKVNFTSVVKVINALGGIRVYSPKKFKSSIAKYKYKKGYNIMSGKQALYFARERKAFNNEDAIRVENQQRVMKGMVDRLLSSEYLLTRYGEILEIAADDLETDMPLGAMQSLVKMQMSDLSPWDIETQKITGEYDMDYVASLTQEQQFQIYRPDQTSVNECIDKIHSVMNPTEKELKEAEDRRKKSSLISFLKRMIASKSSDDSE